MAHPDALPDRPSHAVSGITVGDLPRRAVVGGALALLGLCAGCGRKHHDPPRPLPDVAVLTGAISAEQGLIGLYDATLAVHPALNGRLAPLLAHHRDHLTVLHRHYVPATNEHPATPKAAVPATPTPQPSVPADQAKALVMLRDGERDVAAGRLNDLAGIPAGLAQLFAAISACEAGHVALLGGS